MSALGVVQEFMALHPRPEGHALIVPQEIFEELIINRPLRAEGLTFTEYPWAPCAFHVLDAPVLWQRGITEPEWRAPAEIGPHGCPS